MSTTQSPVPAPWPALRAARHTVVPRRPVILLGPHGPVTVGSVAEAHLGAIAAWPHWIGIDPGASWSQMQGGVDWWYDLANGVLKSLVFGFAVSFIALYQGYTAKPTPEGVSRATTRTVVVASLAVLGLDFLLTASMFSI